MKKIIYTFAAFLLLHSSLLAQENGFPSIKLKSINGQMIDLADLGIQVKTRWLSYHFGQLGVFLVSTS